MRLFRLGDRIINLEAIAHLQFQESEHGQYCQIFFNWGTPAILLRGQDAIAFWALTRHLSIDITPVKPEPRTELVESA